MKLQVRLYCYLFDPNYTHCCTSCHEDKDLGYDFAEYYPPERSPRKGYIVFKPKRTEIYAEFCCGMGQKHFTRKQWADAVRKKRSRLA